MSHCEFQLLLAAYHDRELDDATRRRVDRHLGDCTACAAELASMRDLSARIAAATAATAAAPTDDEVDSSGALARMHLAVDRAAAPVAIVAAPAFPLLRTAGLLGALAASILIVGGVWLLDARRSAGPVDASASAATPGEGAAVAIAPDWERVAMTLRAEPRPGLMGDSPLSPHYADAIQWMLDGLLPADGRTEGKPWAPPRSF